MVSAKGSGPIAVSYTHLNQIQGQYGKVVYVTANDNFVALNKNTSTVQLAFNNGVPGLNGAGGVTLSGTISDLKIRTDKHGNVTYQYQLQGNSISSTVIITQMCIRDRGYRSKDFWDFVANSSGALVAVAVAPLLQRFVKRSLR